MGATAAILTAVTTAGQTASAIQQGRAARTQGDYAAATDLTNAGLADAQAADAIARGDEAASRYRTGTRQAIGSQRAQFAASGVDVGSGSAADIMGQTARFGELDALTLQNNAQREAWGYQVEAGNARQRSQFDRAAGRNAQAGYNREAVSTLIGGASNEYGVYRAAHPGSIVVPTAAPATRTAFGTPIRPAIAPSTPIVRSGRDTGGTRKE